MQFDAGLTGDAAALARGHAAVLTRLPATVHAFILVELHKWGTLFSAEQRYQRALLDHLTDLPQPELVRATAAIARIEAEAGCDRIARGNPARFQDEAQALLRKRRLLPAWRTAIDELFAMLDPALNARLYPPDAPRRLVVQLYAGDIAVQPDQLWGRFKGAGIRIPLDLAAAPSPDAFRRALFGAHADGAITLLDPSAGSENATPLDRWIIESHQALHELSGEAGIRGGASPEARGTGGGVIGLSYERLRDYRDQLTRALYRKIETGVDSPQAFAAYARSLTIAPAADALLHADDIVRTFIREVLLTGNGTLFVNNTFVEWAAVQALRRAQPRILVTRYGVRDKLKPFSSLLLFSQPRASDQIPLIEDPVGSFIDVEQLSYYVWLNAEKSAAYRRKTLYLFLAEGIDQMLAVRPDVDRQPAEAPSAATLADVNATIAAWLGVPVRESVGRPIPTIIS
jgi:hypothetical protein